MLSDHLLDVVLWGFALALVGVGVALPDVGWWSDVPRLGAASALGGWLGLVASRLDGRPGVGGVTSGASAARVSPCIPSTQSPGVPCAVEWR